MRGRKRRRRQRIGSERIKNEKMPPKIKHKEKPKRKEKEKIKGTEKETEKAMKRETKTVQRKWCPLDPFPPSDFPPSDEAGLLHSCLGISVLQPLLFPRHRALDSGRQDGC